MYVQSILPLIGLKCTFCNIRIVSAEAATDQTNNAPLCC